MEKALKVAHVLETWGEIPWYGMVIGFGVILVQVGTSHMKEATKAILGM